MADSEQELTAYPAPPERFAEASSPQATSTCRSDVRRPSSVLRLVPAFQFDRDRAIVNDFHLHHRLKLAGNHPVRT